MRAYDMLRRPESGVCAVTGSPDTPSKVGVSVADIATGMNAHAAVLEALFERERTNRGQAIADVRRHGGLDGRSASPFRIRQARPAGSVCYMRPSLPIGLTRAARRSVRHCRNSAAERVASVLRRGPAAGRPRRRDSRPTPGESPTGLALDAEIEFARRHGSRGSNTPAERRIAWARFSCRDLIHHPALRRVAVRPAGPRSESLVPQAARATGREMPIVLEMADTGCIRREFGI